ncbi:MAG: hypothetical protein Q8N79_08020 [Candidatus Methanoperedens sp.]|nr:hypothetical protein [Candidatus Methanoperedens sp.]
MTEVQKMSAKERFDLANELVERICSDQDFDTFFMKYYNGKTLELDDDPVGEFEREQKLKIKINKVYVKKSSQIADSG